jgi:hypothetical protein
VEPPATPDCAALRAAVWARSGVVYDADNNEILLATGNGDFVPTSHDWGDSVLAIHPDGTGAAGDPIDSFTPPNFQNLENTDEDLGSTAPAILPTPSASNVRHLGAQGGKDALLRLLNLDNLSGQGGIGHTGGNVGAAINIGGAVLTTPAVWTNPSDGTVWTFVATASAVSGVRLSVDGSGNPSLVLAWQNAGAGTSPLVANNVLYVASTGNIRALAPTTGAVLWQDTQIAGIHWESPVVANGTLYITDESGFLSAYGGVAAAAVPALPGSAFGLAALAILVLGSRLRGDHRRGGRAEGFRADCSSPPNARRASMRAPMTASVPSSNLPTFRSSCSTHPHERQPAVCDRRIPCPPRVCLHGRRVERHLAVGD